MFSSSTVLPNQYCKRNGWVFFQSLYLAPIIRQMNKNLYAPGLLGNFFPFFMEEGGEAAHLMHALVSWQIPRSHHL